MPLRPETAQYRHRGLYAGQDQSLILYKRHDDQQEGWQFGGMTLYNCRRSMIHKAGEPLQGEMMSYHRTTWHIPKIELTRVGMAYINPTDYIFDPIEQKWWQAESPQTITEKQWGTWVVVDSVRIDPPFQSPPST